MDKFMQRSPFQTFQYKNNKCYGFRVQALHDAESLNTALNMGLVHVRDRPLHTRIRSTLMYHMPFFFHVHISFLLYTNSDSQEAKTDSNTTNIIARGGGAR